MMGIQTSRIRLVATIGSLAAIALLSTGCAKLEARDNLNKGVNAFRSGQYSAAADNFKKAIELDPDFPVARLYLATAYMSQYVPGSEAPENKRNADSALSQFQNVLKSNPDKGNELLATQSVANLYYQMKDFPKAEEWNKKVVTLDPKNKEAFYTLGVIAWTQFVLPRRIARNTLNMKDEDPGPLREPKKKEEDVKGQLKAKYWQILTDGVEAEKKALAIDPEYENAMAYMNLLLRYRADLLDTKEQYQADVKEADNWVQKSLETTKIKAKRKAEKAEAGAPVE